MELNPKQLKFVEEYLVDRNGTQAAIRAGYSPNGAESQAGRLLTNARVQELVAEGIAKQSEETKITAAMVLRHMWLIATADPRKLIEHRRCACRHCWGVGHAYQWLDPEEFVAEYQRIVNLQAAAVEAKKDPAQYVEPSDLGGYGYNPTRKPHPECPKCFGEGFSDTLAKDSRDYDEQTALLYAGVKQTRDGLQILTRDQGKYTEMVARHLGMFSDTLRLSNPDGSPIMPPTLIRLVAGPADGGSRESDTPTT
jgi:phage terminase small subunit